MKMSPYRPDNLLNGSRTSTPRKGRVPTMGMENGPGGRLSGVLGDLHNAQATRVMNTNTNTAWAFKVSRSNPNTIPMCVLHTA